MYKISELGKRFHLSRTALLYYDSIDLLKPSRRTVSGYRLYSEEDAQRLERICLYRDMGIGLGLIRELLSGERGDIGILEYALSNMEKRIGEIREQQRKILQAIHKTADGAQHQAETFVAVLKDLGFSPADMRAFHAAYEKSDREGHVAFLQFLGLSGPEIERVRRKTR